MKIYAAFIFSLLLAVSKAHAEDANTCVRMQTTAGDIDLVLFNEQAPITVENFLSYVDSGFYENTIFHRVIDNFMIQGGGFDKGYQRKQTGPAIRNEAYNELKNVKGTIAMARTSDPHSATSQFFINTVDNDYLNYVSKTPRGWGYTVFGQVSSSSLNVVKQIGQMKTRKFHTFNALPKEMIAITAINRITCQ